ncbi:MinD/ParA family protein [Peribacillus kribbensis]|uniref:MinD/ParA family protein n=1 Tax=Peribacillus kribbensis TaxID=356658 RepID=UPI00041158F3|nr:MinD/ParA family protein [Peribacillus kribbensis]
MSDQAQNLRLKVESLRARKETKAIGVISGKGGVGKSNFSLNFAISLAQKGKSVLLFDMDIGMGNIDILMGNTSAKNIVSFFEEGLSIVDVISKGPSGISYIAGGTGLSRIFQLDTDKVSRFFSEFEGIVETYQYIIFDMGAGISEDTVPFILSADEVFVITTPEPTSVTDAYAAIKYLTLQKQDLPFYLICNKAVSDKEGMNTVKRLQQVIQQFLQKDIGILGVLPEDRAVTRAVMEQAPFILTRPHAKISAALGAVLDKYLKRIDDKQDLIPMKAGFMGRLKQIVFKR